MVRRGDIKFLSRLQDDPNTAPIVDACYKAIEVGILRRDDLYDWEASPAWIFNAPLDLPFALRDYAYRMLSSAERKLIETHMGIRDRQWA